MEQIQEENSQEVNYLKSKSKKNKLIIAESAMWALFVLLTLFFILAETLGPAGIILIPIMPIIFIMFWGFIGLTVFVLLSRSIKFFKTFSKNNEQSYTRSEFLKAALHISMLWIGSITLLLWFLYNRLLL